MAISSQTALFSAIGDGVTKVFNVPLYILAAAHVSVTLTAPDGTVTVCPLGGVGSFSYSIGSMTVTGFVLTFQTLGPPAGYKLLVYRATPPTQNTVYNQNDTFPAKAHEAALDNLALAIQTVLLTANSALRLPIGSPLNPMLPTPQTGFALGWSGSGITNLPGYTSPPASSGSIGVAGQWSCDANFFYSCIAPYAWGRIELKRSW